MSAEDGVDNVETFRDCLLSFVIERYTRTKPKPTRARAKGRKNDETIANTDVLDDAETNDAAELSEFVDYLAEQIFWNLSTELRTISYAAVQDNADLAEKYALPLDSKVLEAVVETLPPDISDSLCSYGLIDEPSDLTRFMDNVLSSYLKIASSAPPEYTPSLTSSRPVGCEICNREHLPLTYHHLIPRQVHVKAVKRGWHKEWELNKVAWLCRACHSFVHKIATNEELARSLYDVDLLLEREEVQRWAVWIGRVRWKAR